MINYQWNTGSFETPLQRSLQKSIRRLYRLKEQYRKAVWKNSFSSGSGFVVRQLENSIQACESKIIRLEKQIYQEQQKLSEMNRRESA